MAHVASIGTYLPPWGTSESRIAGDDEDAITMAVEAGRAALLAGAPVDTVVLVTRHLPLLESSNAAVLLAGLGLDPELEVTERLGGAPATLDALGSSRPRTLVIGVDLDPPGAAAAVTSEDGLRVRTSARIARSLPVRTRTLAGAIHDYGDPRLLHDRGFLASLEAAWLKHPSAVAGLDAATAAELGDGRSTALPTNGASSGLFALADMAESETTGPLVGVEQANLSGITVASGPVTMHRVEPPPRVPRTSVVVPGNEMPISLAAYARAFESKVRWEAGRFGDDGTLDFPPRYQLAGDGTLRTQYELVPLPRAGTVYTEATVHVPVPGLKTPYSLVVVELDGVDVRVLVKVTGAHAGSVGIGSRGRLTLRRVAIRSGVSDYGYAFEPDATMYPVRATNAEGATV